MDELDGDAFEQSNKSWHDAGVVSVEVKTRCSTFFSLLAERGPGSCHFYQAPSNHRDLKVAPLVAKDSGSTGTEEPLFDALVQPTDSNLFDRTPISHFLHSIEIGVGGTSLCAHLPLNVSNACCEDPDVEHKRFMGVGQLVNRTALLLRGCDFERLCNIFGLTNYGDVDFSAGAIPAPSLAEIQAFFTRFEDHHFATPDSFKSFLSTFKLESIYTCKDEEPIYINLRWFGDILRALTQVRTTVYDGQHREMAIRLFSQGYFQLTQDLFLARRLAFGDCGRGYAEAEWSNMQCFRKNNIRIGSPVKERFHTLELKVSRSIPWDNVDGMVCDTMDSALSVLQMYGREINLGQSKTVGYGWGYFAADLHNKLSVVGDDVIPEKLAFDPLFSQPDSMKQHIMRILEFVWSKSVVAFDDKTEFQLTAKGNVSDYAKARDDMEKSFTGSVGRLSHSKGSAPIKWKVFGGIVKFICIERDTHHLFNLLCTMPVPSVPQRAGSDWMNHIGCLQNIDWFHHYLFKPIEFINIRVECKLWVERALAERIRKFNCGMGTTRHVIRRQHYVDVQGQPEPVLVDMEPGSCDPTTYDFSDCEVLDPLKEQIQDIPVKKMGQAALKISNSRGTALLNRMSFVITQALVVDLLECIREYGYDPELNLRKSNKNTYLDYYLTQVMEWSDKRWPLFGPSVASLFGSFILV